MSLVEAEKLRQLLRMQLLYSGSMSTNILRLLLESTAKDTGLRWGRPEKYAFGLLKINCGLVQKGYNCPGQSALDLASGAAGQKVIVWRSGNTVIAKTKRTLTSVLPVSKKRNGACVNCGACCKLPYVCPFLKYRLDGCGYCDIYPIRPLNCRRYPRAESELSTADTCGFRFE